MINRWMDRWMNVWKFTPVFYRTMALGAATQKGYPNLWEEAVMPKMPSKAKKN